MSPKKVQAGFEIASSHRDDQRLEPFRDCFPHTSYCRELKSGIEVDRVGSFFAFKPMSSANDHRALLFGIAYRMLGRVTEAEDIVQETYLRFH